MKHHAFLRRTLPLLVLAAVLLAGSLPASAFLFDREEEAAPTVATVAKNGLVTDVIRVSQEDFVVSGEQSCPPSPSPPCLTPGPDSSPWAASRFRRGMS